MRKNMKNSTPFTVRLLGICLMMLAIIAPIQAQSGEGFPTFTGQTRILPTLQYNPTGEIIFPSVIRIANHVSNPLGAYYMYYAPHDAPGGIALAYSNSPTGPWIEYANNPVISRTWSPHYNVSHVSSPDAIWNDSAGKLYLYFHGENTTTRVANSTDGINFTYDKIVVNTSNFNGISEASYARVFKHTMPAKGNTYTMVLMGNNADTRKIYLAWSNDGRNWTSQPTPLVSPISSEGTQLSSANFFPWNGKYYVVYHTSNGNMHATEVGINFDMERHAGVFYDSQASSPDDGKASSPEFVTVGNTLYMYYATGPRLDGKLAFASANLSTPPAAEVIVDNNSSSGVIVTGSWVSSTGTAGYYGSNYLHNDNIGNGLTSVRYTPNIPSAGNYEVYARWSAHSNRASNVPININHSGGTTLRTVSQKTNGGSWYSLGTYNFSVGSAGNVLIRTDNTNGYVVADAIRFVKR